ncbi:type 1 periplasmic binding fold superfamily protein [Flagellimonas algicola]|uniref:Type 1 periplasmic binding fold superfamily protein n=1 Tax=Flagellimonas algicola TaxID=2583815 RepID=A0ABY2WMY6_9FLAO|nr:type 1 periplasmic binding fold superfamily protein [Allomuricauda algicola]TMU56358.1 type 1 periplasmic binding fold superfamily protein [Allomuricauda algicola]
MKTIKFLSMAILAGSFLASCSSDDNSPEEINEEETITTMTVTLTPDGGGTAIELKSQDLDGDGPNAPVITISGNLAASTTYNGSIELLNETETPAEDITEEVAEEDDEHQFFFVTTGSIDTVTYSDEDGDGNPVGIEFSLTTGAAGSATLAVTLRHEPKKPNNGTLSDAGGETDITQTFSLTVE